MMQVDDLSYWASIGAELYWARLVYVFPQINGLDSLGWTIHEIKTKCSNCQELDACYMWQVYIDL